MQIIRRQLNNDRSKVFLQMLKLRVPGIRTAEADALTVTVDGGVVYIKNRHSRESRHPESHRSRP